MKIALCQCNFIVADFKYNLKKIKNFIETNKDSELIVFSELCITGYYPYDLLMNKAIIESQNKVITEIQKITKNYGLAVIIGAATKIEGKSKLHNSALVISKGKIIFKYHKKLIPNYSLFNESRHFISGNSNPTFNFKNKKMAILICEDIWFNNNYEKNPIDFLQDKRIELVIVINASPSIIGKIEERKKIVKKIAKDLTTTVAYLSQVGGYDEVVYDGSSFISNKKGEIILSAKSFEEDTLSFNLKKFKKGAFSISHEVRELILKHIFLGLKDYVRKCGFKGVAIGSSGGIDSALTIAIASLAIGKKNVEAITMPSIYSSIESVNDSEDLCDRLGVKLHYRSIADEFLLACRNFKRSFSCDPKKITKENIQARIRGRIMMEYSNNTNLIVLTTGNKSEIATGYTTLYGDMCGAFNPIGDLYKSEVYTMAKYINKKYNNIIPLKIIKKSPSAELSEQQKDSDHLPNYDNLDKIIRIYLNDNGFTESRKRSLSIEINNEQKRYIAKLIQKNEFKRQQGPKILILRERSFGVTRQIPITGSFRNF